MTITPPPPPITSDQYVTVDGENEGEEEVKGPSARPDTGSVNAACKSGLSSVVCLWGKTYVSFIQLFSGSTCTSPQDAYSVRVFVWKMSFLDCLLICVFEALML